MSCTYLQIKLKDILELTPDQIASIGDVMTSYVNFSIDINNPEISRQSKVSLIWKRRGILAQVFNLPRTTRFWHDVHSLRLHWTYADPANITDEYQLIICENKPGSLLSNQIISNLNTVIHTSKPTKTLTDMIPYTKLTELQFAQAIWNNNTGC